MAVKGVFLLQDVREEQLSNNWPTLTGDYIWFGGGLVSGYTTSIVRISADFGGVSLSRSVLNLGRQFMAGIQNSTYGWFVSGESISGVKSYVDRITYSTDTVAASLRGNLAIGVQDVGGASSNNYGNLINGLDAGSASITNVQRIMLSSDTATAVTRGVSSFARYGIGAKGTSSYGWFAGGSYSTIERVSFLTDVNDTVVRGKLPNSNFYFTGAIGNSSSAWFSPGSGTSVSRINYATDTATGVVSFNTISPRMKSGSASGSSSGFFAGSSAPQSSTIDKVNFATETSYLANNLIQSTQGCCGVSAVMPT